MSALLATVRTFLAPLYAAADAVTLLDVLMAFAMRAVHDKRYGSARCTTHDATTQHDNASARAVRPSFGDGLAPIALKQARHPVFELVASGNFVPVRTALGAAVRV